MPDDLEEAFDRWYRDLVRIVVDVNAMAILEELEATASDSFE